VRGGDRATACPLLRQHEDDSRRRSSPSGDQSITSDLALALKYHQLCPSIVDVLFHLEDVVCRRVCGGPAPACQIIVNYGT